jgi:hypothetical protein
MTLHGVVCYEIVTENWTVRKCEEVLLQAQSPRPELKSVRAGIIISPRRNYHQSAPELSASKND